MNGYLHRKQTSFHEIRFKSEVWGYMSSRSVPLECGFSFFLSLESSCSSLGPAGKGSYDIAKRCISSTVQCREVFTLKFLNFPTHRQEASFHLFKLSLITMVCFYSFKNASLTLWLNLLWVDYYFNAIVNECVF